MKNLGILFDYNGVIVDDEHLQRRAMNKVLKDWQIELTEEMFEKYCLGQSDKAGFENLKRVFVQLREISTEDLVEKKLAAYQHVSETTLPLHPGIKELLEKLSLDFRIGLVTGSLRSEMDPILEKGKIRKFFEVIITADDISRPKPDPEGYVKGIAALGLPKENIVVVEDSPAGVTAAKAAGLKCIAVLQTVTKDKLSAADKIIPTVTDITPEFVARVLKADQSKS